MKFIVIMNPKGGVGKSTLAINIAGYFANQKKTTVIVDTDLQNSAKNWLTIRPKSFAPIKIWNISTYLSITLSGEIITKGEDKDSFKRTLNEIPYPDSYVIIDSGANLPEWKKESMLDIAHKVVIPLQPSFFDMIATFEFMQTLRYKPNFNLSKVSIVAMRVNPRTQAWSTLMEFCESKQIDLLTYISDTQKYSTFSITGTSLFDFDKSKFNKDFEQWAPLCEWLQAL